MIRQLTLLAALVAVSSTLKCYGCGDFNYTSMSEVQSTTINGVLTLLGAASCESESADVIENCDEAEDTCLKITMTSKLNGETEQTGYVLQCGVSANKDTMCTSYTTLAGGMNIVISACETETCATDKCNGDSGADSITSSAILIFLTLTTFLLRL